MLGQVQSRWIEGTKDVALSNLRNQSLWTPSLLPLLATVLFLSRKFSDALDVLKQLDGDSDLSPKRKAEMDVLHTKILLMMGKKEAALQMVQELPEPLSEEIINLRRL